MMTTLDITGGDELAELLDGLSSPELAASVSRTAVRSGLKVLRKAAIKASPGLVKLEYGQRLTSRGTSAEGEVGLGVGGYRAGLKRPHGVYLERGTPYIPARHFASRAFAAAMPRARERMLSAAKFRINLETNHQ